MNLKKTSTFSFRLAAFRAAGIIKSDITDQQILKNLESNGYAVKDNSFYLKSDITQPYKPPIMLGNYTVENFEEPELED